MIYINFVCIAINSCFIGIGISNKSVEMVMVNIIAVLVNVFVVGAHLK